MYTDINIFIKCMEIIEVLRKYRVLDYAIFDLSLSFIGIYLLSPLLIRIFKKFDLRTDKITWIILTLPLSILIHALVGSYTLMTKRFLDPYGNYLLKLFILLLVLVALKRIRDMRRKKSQQKLT